MESIELLSENKYIFSKDEITGIRYISFGKGDRTMVVVPGLTVGYVTDNAAALVDMFSAFLDEYTVYLFDIREEVPSDYTIESMSEDLKDVLKRLNLKNIYMYGCSMGGMQTMYIAGRYPELLKKVVIASSSYISNDASKTAIGKWVSLIKEGKYRKFASAMGQMIYSDAVYKASEEAFFMIADNMTDEIASRFINTANTVLDIDLSKEVKNIKCPVFVLGSEGDIVMTADASRKIAAITGGKVYIYGSEYPHAVYDEAPDFRNRVKEFFDAPF